MKILHICVTGPYTDGFNYQENLLTKYQAKNGYEVHIIASEWRWGQDGKIAKCKEEKEYKNQDGVFIHRLKIKRKKDIFYRYKRFEYLGKTIEKIEPDIIFIHNLQFFDIDKVVRYAQTHRVKLYADNHADYSNSARSKMAVLFYKIIWRHMAQIIEPYTMRFYGVLPARVDFLKDIYKLPKEKCELLVMGADDEETERAGKKENRKNVRNSLEIKENDFLIVTGGKIDEWKTQTLLLMEAINKLNKQNIKLLIFGPVSDAIKGDFERLFNRMSMSYISWADTVAAYDYFAIADLVVFPGRHSVYWEQVAGQGIPMLCKYWDGTTHVDVGGNVEFLKEDSVDEIKSKIEELLNCPEKYNHMKTVAVEKGMETFSYRKIAERAIRGVKVHENFKYV